MFRLTRSQTLPVGIDIGRDSLKLLQLELVEDKRLVARAAARLEVPTDLPPGAGERIAWAGAALRRQLLRPPFVGRSAVIVIPRDLIHLKSFRLPPMPAAEIQAAVEFEASHLFPFPPEQATIRCIPAGEVRQGNDTLQEVIVMAVRNADIDAILERMHAAGMRVESLDVEPCALFRCVERFVRRREDEQEVHVLVDIGHAGTQVVIGRGREISFMKIIEIGGSHLNDAVAKRLEIGQAEARDLRRRFIDQPREPGGPDSPDAVRQAVCSAIRADCERLAREVALCLRYQSVTFRGWRPARVRMLGGESCDPMLQSAFASAMTIPVEVARPLAAIDCAPLPPAIRRGFGEWGVALGAALRTVTGPFGPRDGKKRESMPTQPAMDEPDSHTRPAAAETSPVETEVVHA